MAETSISLQTGPTEYSQTGLAVTMTAADVGNGNVFTFAGSRVLIIAQNTGGSSYTVTITSQADPVTGRTGHVSAQSLAAGEIRVFRIPSTGWADTSSKVYISASNTAVKFGLVKESN